MKPSEPHSNKDENLTPYSQRCWINLIKDRIKAVHSEALVGAWSENEDLEPQEKLEPTSS
jgi:hypothetical protein